MGEEPTFSSLHVEHTEGGVLLLDAIKARADLVLRQGPIATQLLHAQIGRLCELVEAVLGRVVVGVRAVVLAAPKVLLAGQPVQVQGHGSSVLVGQGEADWVGELRRKKVFV